MMQHKFVEFIPSTLDRDILYISIEYKTIAHLCACGCGEEVITPITPTDWKLIFNGKSISLHPSIGNWDFKCQSHYWIKENKVLWAEKWNNEQIQRTKDQDKLNKEKYYSDTSRIHQSTNKPKKKSFLSKIINLLVHKNQNRS